MAAWRGVRRDRRILGSVGAGSARCLVTKFVISKKFRRSRTETSNDDSEVMSSEVTTFMSTP